MRETIIRSLSGVAYIILLSGAVFFSHNTLYSFFAVAGLFGTFEYIKLTGLNKTIALLFTLALLVTFYFIQGLSWLNFILVVLSLLAVWYGIYFLFSKKITITFTAKWLLLLGYIIIPFLLLTQIPFATLQYQPQHLFAFFILIWINDTFAFVLGKLFGRHKLMPRISPKKTVEGFFGGLVFTIIGGMLTGLFYLNESGLFWAILAAVVSITGPLGDLFESKLKRLKGVKDSGQIMPGHGGVLDRLDSVIFSAPFVFLFLQFYNYVS